MNPDRLQLHLPATDPAPRRRPCGCRGDGRGQHQAGCGLRGRKAFWAHAWTRLASVRLTRESLDAATPEQRDAARRRLFRLPGGRRLFVRAVVVAAPDYRPRPHVMRGLGPAELAAAREADALTAARLAALRGRP